MLAYGKYHYKYASGREGDWATISLAPNKNYISLYLMCADISKGYFAEAHKAELPKASVGKSCIRYKKFEDMENDFPKLAELMKMAIKLNIIYKGDMFTKVE